MALVAVSALATACADAPLLSPADQPFVANHQAAAHDVESHKVAHALALAMARQDVRVQVRNAMRASRVTEHKLVLQDFITTPGGAHVLRAAAAAVSESPDQLAARIAALPALDFYLPFAEHRISWRATGGVLVGATMNPDEARLVAYSGDGGLIVLTAGDGVPAQPLLILHPAEPKSLRLHPQAETPGEVVQEFDDGQLSGTIGTMNTDCGGCEVEYNPGTGSGGGGGGGGSSDVTYLDLLFIEGWGDAWGSSEIDFRTTFRNSTGEVLHSARMRLESIKTGVWYYPHVQLIDRELVSGAGTYFNVRLVEIDLFNNDDQGNRDFFATDRAQVLEITNGHYYMYGNQERPEKAYVELDWFL